MIGIAETVKPALWFPGRNDDALVGDLWRRCRFYMPLWESGGALVSDLAGYGYSGTFVGGTTWLTTQSGLAVDFDGTDGRINLSDNVSPSGLPFSVAYRALFPASGSSEILVDTEGSNSYYGVWTQKLSSDVLVCNFGDGDGNGTADRRSVITDAAMPIGVWLDVLFVCRGATDWTVYVDGLAVSVSYSGGGGAYSRGTSAGYLGYDGAFGDYGEVQLQYVAIWDRALVDGDAIALAANPFVMIRQSDFAPFWDVAGVAPPSFIPYPYPRGLRGGHSVQTGGLV